MSNEITENSDLDVYGNPSNEIAWSTYSRTNLYSRINRYAPKAIRVLVRLLTSKNANIRFRSAVALLAKVVPDVKQENTNPLGNNLTINLNMGNGYKPLSGSTIIDSDVIPKPVIDSATLQSVKEIVSTVQRKEANTEGT